MKNLIIVLLMCFGFAASAQEVPEDIFENHMQILINDKDFIKEYGVSAQDKSRQLYINLGCYEQYHRVDPIDVNGRPLFLWNEGTIFFNEVEYPLELLRIRYPDENMVFYEFTYMLDKKKHFVEVKFVKRYQNWELVDIATTKLNQAY
ncbi:MAG: hypothetical protein ACLFPE_04830 [Bacteroidales bacterium]